MKNTFLNLIVMIFCCYLYITCPYSCTYESCKRIFLFYTVIVWFHEDNDVRKMSVDRYFEIFGDSSIFLFIMSSRPPMELTISAVFYCYDN